MRVQFLGATRTVTGSMHLISVNGASLLLDCGLFQGRRKEAFERNRTFPFEPSSINAVVLSHAHIDHSGNLPSLVRQCFEGTIYATAATRDLCSIMLQDSAHVQQLDVEHVNKKRARQGEPPVETLYTVEDALKSIEFFKGERYHKSFDAADGVQATYYDAGHILGSALTVLEASENGKQIRLGFTGDLGRQNLPILKDPEFMGDVDYLICESTYGGRFHKPMSEVEPILVDVLKRTVERKGKIIVPAFSVGRTQELVYELHQLFERKELPEIPIYVDSPLSVNATEVFRMHPECYDTETLNLISRNEDPFGFRRLHYIQSVEESKRLNSPPANSESCMIIAASGMCEGGRILHHLANSVEDSRNTILIVGYMAENTLGKRIVERQPVIKIFGEEYNLRAEVVVMNSFSAHADQAELVRYISQFNRKRLKHIFLVHGDLDQAEKLAAALSIQGFSSISIPNRGDEFELS
ncbi:MAG: MBL fold metallo-hydrolase RNA specificity domain-containing protein [Bacteroidota bacterium]